MFGIDLSVQLENMMPFIGLGVSLAAIYDIFGIVRGFSGNNRLVSLVADFSYCILSAAATYLLFLGTTSGVIRLYLLLSELTGAVVYSMTAGRLVRRVTGRLFEFVRSIFRKILTPFFKLKSKFRACFVKISEKHHKKQKKPENKLKKCLKHTE